MKTFMDNNFMLNNEIAEQLYHNHAASLPIIDYHCHLNPEFIAKDRKFDNLGQIWLEGDHYKWRAMRTNGIEERFLHRQGNLRLGKNSRNGQKPLPYTMRNPLYHWSPP